MDPTKFYFSFHFFFSLSFVSRKWTIKKLFGWLNEYAIKKNVRVELSLH